MCLLSPVNLTRYLCSSFINAGTQRSWSLRVRASSYEATEVPRLVGSFQHRNISRFLKWRIIEAFVGRDLLVALKRINPSYYTLSAQVIVCVHLVRDQIAHIASAAIMASETAVMNGLKNDHSLNLPSHALVRVWPAVLEANSQLLR